MSTAEVVNFPVSEVKKVADLEDGYTRIANDLLEAFYSSNLTERQFKIVMFVIRKTYGFNKKSDYITNTQIAESVNVHHTHICKSKIDLIDRKILILDGRKIGVNKNISEWVLAKTANVSQISKSLAKSANVSLAKSANAHYPNQLNTKDNITKEKKDNNKSDFVKPKNSINFDLVIDAFNDAVEDKLPTVKKLTTARKNAVKNLLKEFEEPTFQNLANYFYDFVDNAKPFYFGENDRNWKADFDYIIKPATYLKVIEGSL